MYLRDLDLRGEIWGGCRFTKSSRFLYHPHTQTRSGLAFWLKWSGTKCGIEQFLSFFLYVLTETVLIKFWFVDLQVNRTFSLQDESNKCTFRSVWYVHYIVMALFFPSLHQKAARAVTVLIHRSRPHILLLVPVMYSNMEAQNLFAELTFLHVLLIK